jgi:hypothetical protein
VLSQLSYTPTSTELLTFYDTYAATSAAFSCCDFGTILYEIRDALSIKFGGERNTCSILNVSKNEWSRFGRLANDEPLYEGRHRGENVGQLRHATESELAEVRGIARQMILAYLKYLG